MIDLCLINPPHLYLVDPNAQAALGIMYVAAAAEKAGYSVQIVNGSHQTVEQVLQDIPVARVYGITGTSLDYSTINRLAQGLYMVHPLSVVLCGGPVTLGDEYLSFDYLDSIVYGEAEEVILDILQTAVHSGVVESAYHSEPVNINAIPLPARHLWPGKLGGSVFRHGPYFGDESTILVTSRGCPNRCAFCASNSVYHQQVRLRDVVAVVDEMEQIVVDFGIRQFRLSDENLTTSRAHVTLFCEEILRRRTLSSGDGEPAVAWRASIRAKPNELEMFALMRLAGCREVSIGVESADPDVLRINQKGIQPEDAEEALLNASKAGVRTRALFMVGLPGETDKTFELNKAFMYRHSFDTIAVTMFAPFPGCEIRENPEKFRCEVLNSDPVSYNFYLEGPDGPRELEPFIRPWDVDYESFKKNAQELCHLATTL